MDSQDLRKMLAGVSVVTLLAGAAVTGCATGKSS